MHRLLISAILAGALLLGLVAGAGAVDLTWTGSGTGVTGPVALTEGMAYLSIFSPGGVYVRVLDSSGESVGTGLLLEAGNGQASKGIRVDRDGDYTLSIAGSQSWTVSLTDPPAEDDPEAGLAWTGTGAHSTGLFTLEPGTYRLVLKSTGSVSADLLDADGQLATLVVVSSGEGEDSKEFSVEEKGEYLANVEGLGTEDEWTFSVVGAGGGEGLEHSWEDSGDKETERITLSPGLVYLSASSAGQVTVGLLNASGVEVDHGYLTLLEGNEEASKAVRLDTAGEYYLSIRSAQAWNVSLTDPPEDLDPGREWVDRGMQSTGFFRLEPGTVRLTLSLDGIGYATLFDEQGNTLGSAVKENANPGLEAYRDIAIPAAGRYLVNVEVPSTSGEWTLSVLPVEGDQKKATAPGITTVPTVPPTPVPTTVSRFGARRYVVGSIPSNPPVGTSIRTPVVAPTRTGGQFGSGSTSYSPPTTRFSRWYPATRWRVGQ